MLLAPIIHSLNPAIAECDGDQWFGIYLLSLDTKG